MNALEMDSEGRVVEVVLGTEFSDYDRRTGDNKIRPKNWRRQLARTIRFVIQPVLHSVYDSLDRLATRGPIDNISLPIHSVLVPPLFHLRGATSTASSLLLHGLPSEVSCSPAVVVSK